MSLWVGVDVGGTFTDLVAIDAAGNVETRKVLSTPSDQSEGVIASLRALNRPNVARFVHGTTVATNMLLERSGARVALCVTEGFTDLLYLRRQDRASLYDLSAHWPQPLAPRELTVPVPERIEPQGITRPLTRSAAAEVAERVAALRPDVVAVVLLHAYRDASHEQLLREALRARMPSAEVVLSSEVFPEIREYERGATTAAEAYLRPGVSRYLRNLSMRLTARPTERPDLLGVMTSSGGMRTLDEAQGSAAQLALSGPAGGVVGAAAVARALGIPKALTIDIGGTSADVGLIVDGEPLVEPGGTVADVPIAMPRVHVETVSAGGGSLAWVDDGGALRVGPRSAGAVPGPAAFGRGGAHATVTDAHVVLERITDARMSGGVALDTEAAAAAVKRIAGQLRETEPRTARAIIATADAAMARALRRVSVERGIDPRDCALIVFGGGGPLHGCGLADLLGVGRIVVPPHAGVLSAVGLAMTPERREAMTSVMRRLDAWDVAERDEAVASLAGRLPGALRQRTLLLRMRYAGQGHELDVSASAGASVATMERSFTRMHAGRYGFSLDAPVEVVSMRMVATGAGRKASIGGKASARRTAGPVSIPLPDATLWIDRGWSGRALAGGGWILERR